MRRRLALSTDFNSRTRIIAFRNNIDDNRSSAARRHVLARPRLGLGTYGGAGIFVEQFGRVARIQRAHLRKRRYNCFIIRRAGIDFFQPPK